MPAGEKEVVEPRMGCKMTGADWAERVRAAFEYEEETGLFRWRERPDVHPCVNRRRAGRVAGTPNGKGYTMIRVDGRAFKAHRLAWLYVYGSWPVKQIDHINGVKNDNRIANLREADNSVNQQNRCKPTKGSNSKYLGVCWSRASQKWMAVIRTNGRQKYLGVYECEEDARDAYLEAKAMQHLGFVRKRFAA